MGRHDPPRIGLSGALLDAVFPFHFVVDDDLRVVQAGPAVGRVAPRLGPGVAIADALALRRPRGAFTLAHIRASLEQPFILEAAESGVRLRGQFVELEPGRWAFLGSPWFESPAEIEAAGVSLVDYPVHDPMVDLLMLSQTQRMAMKDLQELTGRLREQREATRQAERIYRQAIAAAGAVVYRQSAQGDHFDFIDAGIESLTGYRPDELTPSLLRRIVVDSHLPRRTGPPAERAAPSRCELRIQARDGVERWLSEVTVPVLDAEGRISGTIGIFEDITARKSDEAERARLSAELDTVLRLSPQGFASFDALGRLSYCNPAFADMLDSPQEALEGKSLAAMDEVFGELAADSQPCAALLDLEGEAADEVVFYGRQGRTVSRSFQRVSGASSAGGWVLFMRDVSREREIDRMKSEFLATAAHELRTPMTSVRGFAELLLHEDFDAGMTRDIAETIHRQATLLVHIVNELLDIARIEAGHGSDFVYGLHSVQDLVRQTVDALRIPGDDRPVRVAATNGDAPVIQADAKKTMLALTNVLSNAYKYSPGGGEITLELGRRQHRGRPEAGIVVTDRGVGMDESELNRIFERFYRADPSGTIPGTGLGLSLVKEIMELQDGSVEVASRKGEGTTVTLWLPEDVGSAGAGEPEAARRVQDGPR